MKDCSTVLEQPASGFQFPETGLLSTSPFTLNGAPMRNHPQSVKGITENARRTTAITNPHDPDYFENDNYYSYNTLTENILPTDHTTELRFHELNLTYSLSFICAHRNLWDDKTNGAFQISLFFLGQNNKRVFHICIPVQYVYSNDLVNPFLNAWFNPDSKLPNPFTVNQIFDFGIDDDIKFSLTEYCLKYNQGRNSFDTYHLCLFKTPIKVNQNNLPGWLANDLYLQKKYTIPAEGRGTEYRRTQFDEIMNQQLTMMISSFTSTRRPEPLVSKDIYFDTFRKQNVFVPVFFNVDAKQLLGTAMKPTRKETFANPEAFRSVEGFETKVLENVKCYPINLKTQVKNNQIQIDTKTNRPITPDQAASQAGSQYASMVQQEKASNNLIYWIAFSVIGIFVLLILVVLIVFIFKGRTSNFKMIQEAAAAAAANAATAAKAAAPSTG
jgi:hypothetical protein